MGVRIVHDRDQGLAALFCSTSDFAFGPVFSRTREHDADERAEAFLQWLDGPADWPKYERLSTLFDGYRRDARMLSESGIQSAHADWLKQEAAQWANEEAKASA